MNRTQSSKTTSKKAKASATTKSPKKSHHLTTKKRPISTISTPSPRLSPVHSSPHNHPSTHFQSSRAIYTSIATPTTTTTTTTTTRRTPLKTPHQTHITPLRQQRLSSLTTPTTFAFSTLVSPPIIDFPSFKPKMLSGKKIIITGASSGIGDAAVRDAIDQGAQVVAIGRNEEKLQELQQATKCHYLVGDLTLPEDCKRMVDEAAVLMDGITSLVNCAGVLKGGAVGSVGLDNFQFNFTNNVQSVWSMIEYTTPYLKLNDDGTSIVNISSVNGQQSFAGVGAYCAAKAAVDMLTKCAAIDLAPFKIRVNSICPGVVATNLQKTGGLTEEAYAGFIERSKTVTHPLAIPRGEVAQPQDVANLITFLVSDKAKWITGDNIKIDAGRSAMGAR